MKYYDFTISFDDGDHSLNAQNGLPIEDVAELLSSLSKAITLQKDDKIVLSEIRGNCYALNLTTSNEVVYNSLKVVHKQIHESRYLGMNSNQRKYARILQKVSDGRYFIKVYDKSKAFDLHIDEVTLPEPSKYFYEIGTIEGVLTKIGSGKVSEGASIHLHGISYNIQVDGEQELKLIKYYKGRKLRLTVQRKIETDSRTIKEAQLIDFNILSDESFSEKTKEIDNIRNELANDLDKYLSNNPIYD
ncbi:MAG: hypothetical protein QM503_04615 [Bacteroidota bacterium]